MKLEIVSAADFLVQLLRLQAGQLSENQLQMFKSSFTEVVRRRYQHHWFPDKPNRGSGYRCIRINGKMDPVIAQAGINAGLVPTHLHSLFPSELTMWIDPAEVSYRIGENGSICVLFEGTPTPSELIEESPSQQQNHRQSSPQQQQQRQQLLLLQDEQQLDEQQQQQPQSSQQPTQQQHAEQQHQEHHHPQQPPSPQQSTSPIQPKYQTSASVQHIQQQQQPQIIQLPIHHHQQQFESCKDSLLLEHTQFSEQIAAYVSS